MSTGANPHQRTRLVVIFGGRSAEHDISCISAANVIAALDPARYEVDAIGVTRAGIWTRADANRIPVGSTGGDVPALRVVGEPVTPSSVLQSVREQNAVVFPLVHGPLGEDGTLQGLLELSGVPYVGSGVLGSAICMDKSMAKTLAQAADIPQAAGFNLTPGSGGVVALADRAELLMHRASIDYPVFVKPANMGSSVGISKALTREQLETAFTLALRFDERLVVEEAVDGREIEVAVLGNAIGNVEVRASIAGEIVPGAEFYDFADKYTSNVATLLIPAELDDAEMDAVRALALESYRALRCDGLARVDFFYEPRGRGFLLNEINTIPGFTPSSMYPKLWEASGLDFRCLLDELVDLARDRHARRSGFSTEA